MPFRKFVEKNARVHSKESHKKINILRIMLLFAILFAGAVGATLSYSLIRDYQYQLYEQEFESLVQDNLRTIKESINLKLQMSIQVATFSSLNCPNESDWPNCAMTSTEFTDRTRPLIAAAQITQIGSFPIIRKGFKNSFETFAKEYFSNDGGYPIESGYSSFGFGIFTKDSDNNRVPSEYDNSSTFSDILVPIFQLSNISSDYPLILYDAHSDIAMRNAMEKVLNCSINIVKEQSLNLSYGINRNLVQTQCSSLTDFIPTYQSKYTAIGVPIYPSINPDIVVGFAGSLFSWESILSSTSRYDASFNCLIESSTSSIKLAFSINHGIVREVNQNNIDDDFQYKKLNNKLKKSFLLNDNNLFATETVYVITYYPSNELPSQFIAIIACICCIGVTLLILIIFEIFNSLIKREAHETNILLDSKRIFVRFISHEIRTPLNTVILGLKLLEENLDSFKKNCIKINDENIEKIYCESIELIHELSENASIAVTTLNDLINYDKIESKKFTIEKKLVDIVSIIEKTVNLLSLQAKEKEIKLIIDLFNQSEQYISKNDIYNIQILGDSIKIGQVIRNLVSNALKFTPKNGIVSISVNYYPIDPIDTITHLRSTSQEINYQIENTNCSSSIEFLNKEITGNIFIEISDNGPGLSSEQLKSMFREGVQFNPNELQAGQGSGLGLWISREIVSLHNGTIDVKSQGLGKGSTFEVKLPVIFHQNLLDDISNSFPSQSNPTKLIENMKDENIPQKRNEMILKKNSSLEGKMLTSLSSLETKVEHYVLVVDDAPSNRKLVCRILKSRGYICHEAENGLECVNIILSSSILYDFIILDYEMPLLDGPSAAKQLRDQGCKILIIGVTGNVLPEDKEYFINHGANIVLPKPVNIDNLLANVNILHSNV